MFTIVSRLCRRHLRPVFLNRLSKLRILYDIAGWFCTQMIVAYIMSSFFVRSLDHTMHAYSQMYYYGHIMIAGTWIFFHIPGVTRVLKMVAGSEKNEADRGEGEETAPTAEVKEKNL